MTILIADFINIKLNMDIPIWTKEFYSSLRGHTRARITERRSGKNKNI